MENQFSFLDIQFIRASLNSKSDGEIAAILELPVELVHDKINEITGGGADDRSQMIQEIHEKEFQKLQEIKNKKTQQLEKKERQDKDRIETSARLNREQVRIAEKSKREGRSKYKTRDLHLDELLSVKIDHKTTVLVKPGTDIEKIKQQYYRPPISKETVI